MKTKIDIDKVKRLPTIEDLFEKEYGKKGTPLRDEFDAKSRAWYYAEILKIRSDIYSNPSVKYTVEMLAEKLHISKHYFHHLYKKFFDVPPVTDIINSRIEHAKRLLRSTDYSVKEIAEILGYSTDTQFMKQFKGVTEMSASEYRKKATV